MAAAAGTEPTKVPRRGAVVLPKKPARRRGKKHAQAEGDTAGQEAV